MSASPVCGLMRGLGGGDQAHDDGGAPAFGFRSGERMLAALA
jgi:hypothetical protein